MFNRHDTLTDKIFLFIVYIAMFLMVITMVYPFWDRLIISLSMREATFVKGFRLYTWPLNLEPYRTVLGSHDLWRAFANTIYRVVVGTAWTLIITSITAYPLSRDDMPLKGPIMAIFLFTMMFGGGLIPNYLLRKSLGLIDKRIVLILPGISAWNLIIMRRFFESIAKEVQEAAEIDGASPFGIWWKVILPLSKPVLATIALWSAVGHWNAYFDVLIYITDRSKFVLQIILRRIILEENQLVAMGMKPQDIAEYQKQPTDEMVKAALLMVTTVPILLVYPFLQRYFIKGIMLGSVKG